MTEDNYLLQKVANKALISVNVDEIKTNTSADEFKNIDNISSSEREVWASKREFLLSCIGYAIGLGNIWRFPYLCYRNGGGAFLIPYLTMLVLCGIPLYFVEMGIGQFSSAGCVGIFRLTPLLKGTGFAMLIIDFICVSYCAVILTYPILFIQKSFASTLPWLTCNNTWNTEQCIDLHGLSQHNFTSDSTIKMAADEFFHNEILQVSSGIEELGGIVWALFWCLIIACLILYLCIIKGIKSVGKVVYFTATFPIFLVLILFIRGVTLPGAIKGILFYIKPDWTRLLELRVWTDAALQIFYSLGPGWGSLVNMASFNHFRNNNIKRDIFIVPIINCSFSIFSGFVVFSVLGYLSDRTGIPVESVATNGPGLVFVTYPQAIAMMPLPHLWSTLFFVMLFLLGMDTVFAQIETIACCIKDEMSILRKYRFLVPIVLCLCIFLVAVIMVTRGGIYILNLLDWYSTSLPLIFVCFLEVIMIAWIYGIDSFLSDITFMTRKKPAFFWKYCLKYLSPAILIFIFLASVFFHEHVTYNGSSYPDWAVTVGWLSCASSIICIPLYMVYIICAKNGSLAQKIRQSLKPVNWKPAKEIYQEEYENFKNRNTHCY